VSITEDTKGWTVRAGSLCLAVTLAASVAPRPAAGGVPEKVYALRELIDRSTLIAIGTVTTDEPSAEGRVVRGFLDVRDVLKGSAGAGRIPFVVDGPPLPVGVRAIWMLADPGPDGVYRVDHPQCAYDMTHRTVLEKALRDPHSIRPGYFLRREDEILAQKVREALEMRAMRDLASGPSADGLALTIRLANQSPRVGGVVVVEFTLANVSQKPMLVCDSGEECYYVRAIATHGGAAGVARAGADEFQVEHTLGLGSLVSEHDFLVLDPGERITRSLTVSSRAIPALRSVGAVKISGVYRYRRPELDTAVTAEDPWAGMIASESVDATLLPPLADDAKQ
jgi:hypothetical protein